MSEPFWYKCREKSNSAYPYRVEVQFKTAKAYNSFVYLLGAFNTFEELEAKLKGEVVKIAPPKKGEVAIINSPQILKSEGGEKK